jgi:hypothetical protein
MPNEEQEYVTISVHKLVKQRLDRLKEEIAETAHAPISLLQRISYNDVIEVLLTERDQRMKVNGKK